MIQAGIIRQSGVPLYWRVTSNPRPTTIALLARCSHTALRGAVVSGRIVLDLLGTNRRVAGFTVQRGREC
jgi:hypothetical protein